ncbi:MAG: tetratricopeptide repeat protein [Candidatus Sericytochromatia bacterium]
MPFSSFSVSRRRLLILFGWVCLGLGGGFVWSAAPRLLPQLQRAWTPVSQIAPYRLKTGAIQGFDREIAFYRQRIQQNPQGFLDQVALADAYLRKARASGENGWYLLAEQAAQRSLARFENMGARLVQAHIALARHDFAEARRLAQQIEKQEPESVQSLFITLDLAVGENQRAFQRAQQWVKHSPSLSSYTQRALAHMALGDYPAAEADFKKAISREQTGEVNGSAMARTWLARLYAQSGQLDKARDLYREALRIQPNQPVSLGLLADLYLRQGDWQAAENSYAKAYQHSQSPSYLLGQAQARQLAGASPVALWEKAEAALRRDLSTGAFGHRRDLARLLLAQAQPGNLQEALTLMQAEYRSRQDQETRNLLAQSFAKQGRWAEAQQVLTAALAQGGYNAEILYRAAHTARALGKTDQAKRLLRHAQTLDPGFQQDPAFQELATDLKGMLEP